MTQKQRIVGDDTVAENVIYHREGDVAPYGIPVSGASTVTTPTMFFYKDGGTTDETDTYWETSPAMSVSGTVVITRQPKTAQKKGEWILSIWAIVDGYNQNVVTYRYIVKRKGEL